MVIQEKSIARLGDVMFYLGGAVWGVYAVVKYLLGWDVMDDPASLERHTPTQLLFS